MTANITFNFFKKSNCTVYVVGHSVFDFESINLRFRDSFEILGFC